MERKWRMVDDEEVGCGGGEEVTVLQWNILSQTLGIHGDFQACPQEALLWDHRGPLLIQEILRHQPDIICLEEVDCFEVLSSHLTTEGYQGFWVPKPNSPCLKFKDNMGPDGNAVFFRKGKFHHKSNHHHELNESNSTLLVCELELKGSGKKTTIYVTHLKAKKGCESVRVAQTKQLMEIIQSDDPATTILAGDFNAGLEEPVYEMVRSLGLESAYKEVLGAEPAYTTWKKRGTPGDEAVTSIKKDTIDFIFFSPRTARAVGVAEMPTLEEIGDGLLPSSSFPSDHMSLVAKFNI